MRCPNCNSENSDNTKFCIGCGRMIPRCPTCGNVLTTRDRFCMNDGTRLPDELLMLVPEEDRVEQVDVVQPVDDTMMFSMHDVIQEPVKTPQKTCLRCGSPVWQDDDYCDNCQSAMKAAAPVCASCGMPCEPGEDYCAYCRPTNPVPVANMDYVPPVQTPRSEPKRKKKSGSVWVVILVFLLLLLIGTAAVLVAAENGWIELPDFLSSQDSGRDRDRDDDDDDGDDGDGAEDAGNDGEQTGTAGEDDTPPPSEKPTEKEAETTAPPTTEPTTEAPTEPAATQQTKLEYFMENCDSVLFTREDIADFNQEQAKYARNACYAQAGRKFKDKTLQAYFEQYSWYSPTYEPAYFDQHDDDFMNYYEKQNLALVLAYEKEMGFR